MTSIALIVHWYFLLHLPFKSFHLDSHLDWTGISLLGLAFAFVMGAGYVVNDLFDVSIDLINKEDRQMIPLYINKPQAIKIYIALNILALLVSLVIGFRYQVNSYFYLLPLTIALLFLYSAYLKKTLLWGNLLIAVLCGITLFLPWLFESESIQLLSKANSTTILHQFTYCGLTAGLLTLSREIIKDQQDIIGDRTFGSQTLPIRLGFGYTKIAVSVFNGVLLLVIIDIFRFLEFNPFAVIIITLGIFLPLCMTTYRLMRMKELDHFGILSGWYKIIMVMGMITLPVCMYFFNT